MISIRISSDALQKNEVTVWAVVDCRRDPDWIREHLGQ